MAAGDPIKNCSTFNLSAEQLFMSVVVEGTDGKPAVRVYDPAGGGGGGGGSTLPLNSAITPVLVQDPAGPGASTLAGLYGAYNTWKAANPTKTPVRITSMTGDDGQNGLLIEFI